MTFFQKKIVDRWLTGVLRVEDAGTAQGYYSLSKLLQAISHDYYLVMDLAFRNNFDLARIALNKYFENAFKIKTVVDKIRSTGAEVTSFGEFGLTFDNEIGELKRSSLQCLEENNANMYQLRKNLLKTKNKIDTYINHNTEGFPGGAICLSLSAIERRIGKISMAIISFLIALLVIGFLTYKMWIVPAIFEYNALSSSNIVYDVISKKVESRLNVIGFDPVEIGPSGTKFRWANGERSEVLFYTARPNYYKLSFMISSLIKNQMISAIINNGEVIKNYHTLSIDKFLAINVQDDIVFLTRPGYNSIVFTFSDYNHLHTTFAPVDTRFLACAFTQLLIYPSSDKLETIKK